MKLKIIRQDAMCVVYRVQDEKLRMFAMCCAGGFMKLLGRHMEPGESVVVDMNITEEVGLLIERVYGMDLGPMAL